MSEELIAQAIEKITEFVPFSEQTENSWEGSDFVWKLPQKEYQEV